MTLSRTGTTLLVAGLMASAPCQGQTTYPSAEEVRPLLVGLSIPEGTLVSQEGKDVPVGPDQLQGPAVYVFYRGHW